MYADRDRYVADPAFIAVPVEKAARSGYLAERAQLIGAARGPRRPGGHVRRRCARGPDATREAAGTSHFVVMDAAATWRR